MEDRVSRTQFQYTLEDPNADELNAFVPKMVERLQGTARAARRGERSAGERSARAAWCSTATPRRASASRRRRSTTRCTTPTASAQVSTMFTQLNQYHVVLEVKPGFQNNPVDLRNLYIRSAAEPRRRAGVVSGGSTNTAGLRPLQRNRWRRPPRANRLACPVRSDRPAAPSTVARRHRHWFSPTEARCP